MLENLVTGFPDELWFEFVKFRQLLKPQFMVKLILMRAGEKAQNTKCLWHRMRTWVHLQGTHIKSRVQQYVFLPSAWGWQWQGRMLGCCRPVHLAKSWHSRLNNRPSPQNIRCRVTHWYQSGFHTHTPTCTHKHSQVPELLRVISLPKSYLIRLCLTLFLGKNILHRCFTAT